MNKKALTEADIRSKFITPALVGANGDKWDLMTQIREEAYFTKGRVIVRGRTVMRGEARKADYLLSYRPHLPLAVIEAKDNHHSVGAGMQQALEYAEILDLPFAYSSNGDAFLEHDRTRTRGPVTREIPLDQFPTPDELWARYRCAKGYDADQEAVATERVQYLDKHGKLITESLHAYTRKAARKHYASLDAFLVSWNQADRKQVILEELAGQGVFLSELADQVGSNR